MYLCLIVAFCIIAIIVGVNAQFFSTKESDEVPEINVSNVVSVMKNLILVISLCNYLIISCLNLRNILILKKWFVTSLFILKTGKYATISYFPSIFFVYGPLGNCGFSL